MRQQSAAWGGGELPTSRCEVDSKHINIRDKLFSHIEAIIDHPRAANKKTHPQRAKKHGVCCSMKIKYLSLSRLSIKFKNETKMKKGIHPENYRLVAFKDMSNDHVFLCRSAVSTKETIEVNGETYPVYKMEISNTSHPFYTGKMKLVDTAGRVDKFMSRYAKRYDKKNK